MVKTLSESILCCQPLTTKAKSHVGLKGYCPSHFFHHDEEGGGADGGGKSRSFLGQL